MQRFPAGFYHMWPSRHGLCAFAFSRSLPILPQFVFLWQSTLHCHSMMGPLSLCQFLEALLGQTKHGPCLVLSFLSIADPQRITSFPPDNLKTVGHSTQQKSFGFIIKWLVSTYYFFYPLGFLAPMGVPWSKRKMCSPFYTSQHIFSYF